MWVTAPVHGCEEHHQVQRDLVVQAQQGDAEAFRALVTASIDRLHGVAYRILGDADRADDATQQALIAAWDHLRSLRDPDRFDAWTYRLTVHAAYREARKARAWRDAVRWIASEEPSTGEGSDRLADRDELEHAFVELTPEHRAVLALRYYADLSLNQIAEVLEIPVGTVGSRLNHAMQRLRAALERERRPPATLEHALS
jgi:RNA polymerase sigma-70 factor, ECF subfamily